MPKDLSRKSEDYSIAVYQIGCQHIIAFTSKAFRHVGFQDKVAKYCGHRQWKVAFST